ncbi:MAG: hypothetical protein CLLPBCKN_004112 [Chroococcidiopsis cubana SAG 39.79]|nr:hypothetical protein [Chroococcidiopsis cubana SAG 39.79]
MNTSTLSEKTEVDYFMTNASHSIATASWFVQTYSQRNWVEVFIEKLRVGSV